MTKIDELMALVTAAIKLYAYHSTDDVIVVDDGKAINDVRKALEAALNIWKRFSMTELAAENPSAMEYCKHWEDRAIKAEAALKQGEPIYQLRSMAGNWIDQSQDSYEYNTRHGHTTRIVYTSPPAPPPRLTDDTITIAYQMGRGHAEGLRSIETEVRKQFGVNE
jgi:hypothetical protein